MKLCDIENAVYPYRKFLVAFSGGLDSTVLLHLLMLLRKTDPNIELRAIHVHHGINLKADKWVEHCQRLCASWDIPILVSHISILNKKLGAEGGARKERYEAFKKALLPKEVLITAQHLNDQAETFLLALKRGSGPSGLSSMLGMASFFDTKLLRPLLNETRESLLNWATLHNLQWIEDDSNQNDCYDRNFLRLRVLPLLTQRWPYFVKSVFRSAQLCFEQEDLLDELLKAKLESVTTTHGTLIIEPLASMNKKLRNFLLRRWLSSHGSLMPSRKMLSRIWNEVAQARIDSSPLLCLNGYTISRFRGQLWWFIKRPSLREIVVNWPDLGSAIRLPYNSGKVFFTKNGKIRLPFSNENVSIRFKATGNLHIIGRKKGRRLKKIWQEHSIPPWLRGTIPLLFYNETLIAAAGVFITKNGWEEKGINLEWKHNE